MNDDDNEETVHVVYTIEPHSRRRRIVPKCNVQVNRLTTTALIDPGASINIMATDVFNQIPDKPTLRPTSIRVYAYGTNTPLPLLGVFHAHIAH